MDGLASQTSSLAMMDDFQKQALRQCHPDLRMSVRVADFLVSLHVHAGGFLNDVEWTVLIYNERHSGNVELVDQLMEILLNKENGEFDYFCIVLEYEGYKVWSDKLKDDAGLGKQQQLSICCV